VEEQWCRIRRLLPTLLRPVHGHGKTIDFLMDSASRNEQRSPPVHRKRSRERLPGQQPFHTRGLRLENAARLPHSPQAWVGQQQQLLEII